MQRSKRKAFTLIEMLVCMAILSFIIGIAITMMTRGASNVQKGSFNALAANQAFWIISTIRQDVARSELKNISFPASGDGVWKGDTEFKVVIEGGTASYSIERRGANKLFVRKFLASSSRTAFSVADNKTQTFGDEYMTDMSVKLENDAFTIDIEMDENVGQENSRKFNWSGKIYIPHSGNIGQYWVPTVERDD